jgi:hypothetical protein
MDIIDWKKVVGALKRPVDARDAQITNAESGKPLLSVPDLGTSRSATTATL